MSSVDKRKRSLYIPDVILAEMQKEALRQDRSLSWIVQQAWKVARFELMRLPGVQDIFKEKHDLKYQVLGQYTPPRPHGAPSQANDPGEPSHLDMKNQKD